MECFWVYEVCSSVSSCDPSLGVGMVSHPHFTEGSWAWERSGGHTESAPRPDWILLAAVCAQGLAPLWGRRHRTLLLLLERSSQAGGGSSAPEAPSVMLVTLVESPLCCVPLVSPLPALMLALVLLSGTAIAREGRGPLSLWPGSIASHIIIFMFS